MLPELSDHYVYLHKNIATGEVFYVGASHGNDHKRAYSKTSRSVGWKSYVADNAGYIVEIPFDNLSEKECADKEIELIKFYGKKISGGSLVNIWDGGQRTVLGIPRSKEHSGKISIALTGKRASEDAKIKMSNAKKGKRPSEECIRRGVEANTGAKRSEECRRKISIAHKGKPKGKERPENKKRRWEIINANNPNGINAIPVICLNNGKWYKSATEAAKELNISDKHIGTVCNGKRNHTLGYKFKYAS